MNPFLARNVWMAMWLSSLVTGGASQAQDEARQLRTDSRSPYFHRLTLYDHDGEAISPEDGEPKPYSPEKTCGMCHAYATIACGWHFGAGNPDADEQTPPGRPGEPWIYVDAGSGTALPISLRGWRGTVTPQQFGMSRFTFAQAFGRHLPGGGWIEPSLRESDATPEAARWAISASLRTP